MTTPVLEIDGLSIAIPRPEGDQTLVHDCTVSVGSGEAVGLVGESGSGKTLSVRAVAGLLPDHFRTGGTIRYEGRDLSHMTAADRRSLRAREIGMVFQSPRAHLNPLRSIGDFLTEAMVTVTRTRPDEAKRKALELLDEVGVSDPVRRLGQRPAELSGGILQRVMIASTLAMDPKLLLADEITTALDVTTQEEVMAIIGELRTHRDLSLLFITHDLTLAGAVCDRVAVMQHGRIVETLNASTMRQDASQQYTKVLMAAALRDDERDRAASDDVDAAAEETAPLLQVADLRKTFQVRGASGKRESFTAVEQIDFTLEAGGSLGIVGESGSGKSTTAKMICGLERADAGTIRMDGQNWDRPARGGGERRERAHYVQMVFQDPYQSLDPRQTVRQCLTEAIRVHEPRATAGEIESRISELMAAVVLDESLLNSRPRPLSGGQRQRVAIARALAASPRVLVLDEAVSALDVTTQVEILSLLHRIRHETGVALLMITHDLTVIRRLCDDVIVMRDGQVEEYGTAEQILDDPKAEYTRQLLESIPRDGWQPKRRNLGRTTPIPTLPAP